MDRRAATAVGLVVAVVVGGVVVAIADAVVLAGTIGIAWGVAAGMRVLALDRDHSLEGPDWWTAAIVSIALLVAVPGLAYVGLAAELKLALGLAILGVAAAGSSLGQARERALSPDADRKTGTGTA